MNIKSVSHPYRKGPRREKGVVATLLAVIVLVATLLAAVALMRSIDTSNTIAGSLAFRQSVLQEATRAYVDAKTKINFSEPTSDTDQTATQYYASLQPSDSRGIPTVLTSGVSSGSLQALPQEVTNGNKVFYVVERMCPTAGAADPTTCIVPGATITGGSSSNQTKDNGPPFATGAFASFRLTVMVQGPQNTVGYVQTMLR